MEKCNVCGEEFETEEGLLKHNSEVHSEVVEDADQPRDPESQRDVGQEVAGGRRQ